jgi:hypothetical protein
MRTCPRRWSAPALALTSFSALWLAGCGQPVREDRSITWSPEGRGVGFQHGPEGVFLADRDGKLKKVFQPDAGVIATSAPLWAADRRVLFTTARPADEPAASSSPRPPDDPAGNIHWQGPVVYTCWLYEEDRRSKPRALFQARCDHPGYVAANLAVRWHPGGKAVLYIDQTDPQQHGLFEHDLSSGRSRRAFPHAAPALLFDFSPGGAHLACVLGGPEPQAKTAGIWVGRPGEEGWWRVPGSERLAPGELPSALERLRASRPAWSPDGKRLAFVSFTPGPAPDRPGCYCLRRARVDDRTVQELAGGKEPFRDLQWSPDGSRLGLVRGGDRPALHLLRPGAGLPAPVTSRPVRRFAGWNASGERLAYLTPDPLPLAGGKRWAFLLAPDPRARDAVHLAPGDGSSPGAVVFSGMRVTFPRWSPTEDELSLWLTFSPAYRSVLSQWLGWGLLPGDPAALLDGKTGRVRWLAVNAHEKVQVGHYHLLRRDYQRAWRFYEEARRQSPAPRPAPVASLPELLRRLGGPQHPGCFEYHCLRKLGREAEAQASLASFRRAFPPRLAAAAKTDRQLGEWLREGSLGYHLLQDLYLAEMFLSLDAAADGEAFFRTALSAARTDAARLSSGLVLAQILLLRNDHAGYAELTTRTVAPLWLASAVQTRAADDPGVLVETLGMLGLVPLAVPDFVATLPRDRAEALLPHWRRLHARAAAGQGRRLVALVLHALYHRLGLDEERHELARQLGRPSGARGGLATPEDVRRLIEDLREGRSGLPWR